MSPGDKKKLWLAIGLLSLAALIVVWRLAFGGPGTATREERAAQEAVLQQMGSKPDEPVENTGGAAAPTAESPPAGRPREVKPGR